jgi:hypothetical protein
MNIDSVLDWARDDFLHRIPRRHFPYQLMRLRGSADTAVRKGCGRVTMADPEDHALWCFILFRDIQKVERARSSLRRLFQRRPGVLEAAVEEGGK